MNHVITSSLLLIASCFCLCEAKAEAEILNKKEDKENISSQKIGTDKNHPKRIDVKDSENKKWILHDWEDGSRPYTKDLVKREAEYKEKWGESWAGVKFSYDPRRPDRTALMSPGKWEHEVVSIKGARKEYLYPKFKAGKTLPGKSQAIVYAPGGGDTVTDIYLVGGQCFIHLDPTTKKHSIIGDKAKDFPKKDMGKRKVPNLGPAGVLDGLEDKALLQPSRSAYSNWVTCDPVTGRIYFGQYTGRKNPSYLRYVEKLLLYEIGGKEMLLPAFLDWNELYKEVGALPVSVDGKRARPRFAVRTTSVKDFKLFSLGKSWGKKILLSIDGKAVWTGLKNQKINLVNIETGHKESAINLSLMPKGVCRDKHEANCGSRFDGSLYFFRHTGAGGGPGRMFGLEPKSMKISMLYDSMSTWPWEDSKSKDQKRLLQTLGVDENGPADAVTLMFKTTCFSFQSPRTGALFSGGWDGADFRRYHDGFVTALAKSYRCRPEWKGVVAGVVRLQSCPDVAPNGDVYFTDILFDGYKAKGAQYGTKEDLRIIRFHRTDWPKEQPVNGYANKFLSPKIRKQHMVEYAKEYIANYDELSKIY